ncbi:unnamed protein product [Linum tenue]|uniref:Uncharacterized protein n=1 Tax=Linum tenue TaxID=586396 RepID=A0AAV0HYQ3_9ROSI|nr:unnamed protein product [Linum tenue]CAI0473633.1 unnamed protein product [Linum tenue]
MSTKLQFPHGALEKLHPNCVDLCRAFDAITQNCISALLVIKETFFKHGEKETLRSCVKALNFSSVESKGELKDYACRMSLFLSLDLLSKKLRFCEWRKLQELAGQEDVDGIWLVELLSR